ncbi:uncharacterized protein LOC6551312 [Drosophila erecta]|uniref:Uncharacterized protein n=1 Tax=Drosophila erecta TaxID=7220 RepID=B3NUB2_DROER|nr:uncharacterized protein LOC6551312 [Drosophila erecta]EDV46027.1 uncharacterized protein Dere_GG18846 [Drosophila erecta]
MPQLLQMTRHVTSWLGWTPTPPSEVEEEEEPPQESSGIVTVLVLYLGMAALFAALNLCTTTTDDQVRARARPKRQLVAMERQQLQRLQRRGRTTDLTTPTALPSLTRDVAAPRQPAVLLQKQRLRMRLLQQKEPELLDSQAWHDAVDVDEEEEELAQGCSSRLAPKSQKSTFFDLPSDSE